MKYGRQVQYIEILEKHGKYTTAAKELYISQPYLSKFISNIEEETGITLFERQQKRMTLTYAGNKYLNYLKRISNLENELQNEIDLLATAKKADLKLGINPALGSTILPKLLPPFKEQYPDVQIQLFEKNMIELESLLEENVIDVAIAMTPIMSSQLSYQYIYEDPLYILIPRSSELFQEDVTEIIKFPYELDVLKTEPLILVSPNTGFRRTLDEFFELNHIKPNEVLSTNTIYTAISLAISGMGSTFIPVTGMNFVNYRDCNIYQFDRNTLKGTFVVVYNKNRPFNRTMKDLWNIAKEVAPNRGSMF